MTKATLALLTIGAALCAVPACDDDTEPGSGFSGSTGQSKGGTNAGKGGGAGGPSSGGAGGEATGSGGDPTGGGGEATDGGGGPTGGTTADGGSESGGSSGQGQEGGSGGSDSAGGSSGGAVSWYCTDSGSSCICVQEDIPAGECGFYDCCYTYDSGIAGLACKCSEAEGAACAVLIADDAGEQVEFCPP